jgi:hypothetical protein
MIKSGVLKCRAHPLKINLFKSGLVKALIKPDPFVGLALEKPDPALKNDV